MAIEKEKFFEIIKNVNEGGGLNEDNLLQKIKDELYEVERKLPEEDCGEYNKFKNDLWKDHLFSVKTSNGPVDYTLLHLAVESNNVLMVKLLIKKTVRVDMRIKDGSSNGLTALHIAASHGYEEIVQLLLDANANPSLEDSQGRIPRKMVEMIDNIQNREIIIKRLETAEKNYSPKKAKDLKIKTKGGGRYHLSQNNHKTQASLAVNAGNVTSTPANVIDPHLERYDSMHSDESVSDDSGLESEQTTPNTSFHFEMNPNGANHVEENVDNKTLESTLRSQIQLKDSRIQELEKSDKELKQVEKKLEKAQEENKSLKQEIKDLKSENTTLKDELEKNKNQHFQISEVPLKKVEKKPPLSKIAYVSLVTTSMVGSILSVVSGLFVLSMIATSVTSALVAGGITYTMSKPTTELKEVNIQSPDNNKTCEI